MTKIAYTHKNFRASSLVIIEQANEIIEEYQDQGFQLTLRQLYYQFVARDLIDNTVRDYNKLGGFITDARLAGLIDWEAIEDRTRNLESTEHWDSPAEILQDCSEWYQIDKWAEQSCRVEVWIEKEALSGIIEPICRKMDIPYFSCRGYVSASEMWVAAQRFRNYSLGFDHQEVHILHFGDHDPSGIDMTRDIEDRLRVFESIVDVRRMALNMDQVDKYQPPPNPAKQTDSRFQSYQEEFGDSSWELDALEPKVIAELISDEVFKLRDHKQYDETCAREQKEKEQLARMIDML